MEFLKYNITNIEHLLLPFLAGEAVIQSEILHTGYILDLSDCKEVPWADTVLSYDQSEIFNGTNVKQRVFCICFERTEQCRKQIFVLLRMVREDSNDFGSQKCIYCSL